MDTCTCEGKEIFKWMNTDIILLGARENFLKKFFFFGLLVRKPTLYQCPQSLQKRFWSEQEFACQVCGGSPIPSPMSPATPYDHLSPSMLWTPSDGSSAGSHPLHKVSVQWLSLEHFFRGAVLYLLREGDNHGKFYGEMW